MRIRSTCTPLLTLLLVSVRVFAQQPDEAKPAEPSTETLEKQRVLGVLPNYRTAQENGAYTPISARKKFYIGFKDSSDYPVSSFPQAWRVWGRSPIAIRVWDRGWKASDAASARRLPTRSPET